MKLGLKFLVGGHRSRWEYRVAYKFDNAGWYMVKGKADLIWGSIAAGCATLLIIGFQHLLRNVDTPSAHGQWRALSFVTQQAPEHQIWGLESCIMFFSFTILLNVMEFQEHSPRKFEIIMWSIWITMYIVHCSFCNLHLTLCFLICCFSNLLYFLYSLFWEFLCLTNNNWLDNCFGIGSRRKQN